MRSSPRKNFVIGWDDHRCIASELCIDRPLRVKRQYRVRTDQRFQEIRRQGRAFTNALLVLCALPNDLPYSRFGFAVNSRIGNAVRRNRIKRRLREIVRLQQNDIRAGWDVILIARQPIRSADYREMESACARLLRRAHLFRDDARTSDDAEARVRAEQTPPVEDHTRSIS